MPFPIKYNSDIMLELFAKRARTARQFAEEMEREYDGSIAGKVSESLIVEPQDREVARSWMEKERAELQQFMDDYQAANKLVVLCRRFILPEYNSIRFVNNLDPRKMPVKDLFFQLGLEDDMLHEVYEFGNLNKMYPGCGFDKRKNPIDYSGRFTKNGRQKLADILQKEITFYRKPQPNPFTKSEPLISDPETFRPSK